MPKGAGRGGKKPFYIPNKDEVDSNVIFGNPKSAKTKEKQPDAKDDQEKTGSKGQPGEDAPKKPDTRTLIAGASWTGKLPVNLLNEHCQKQKWAKPEYSMVCYAFDVF